MDTTTTAYITEPLGPNDVAAGRGARIKAFVGNVRFRQLVQLHKIEYMSTGRHFRKQEIAEQIYTTITQERGGRFVAPVTDPIELQQVIGELEGGLDHSSSGIWKSVGKDKALKKIKQALCEDEVNIPRSATPSTPSGTKAAAPADITLAQETGINDDSHRDHRASHRSDTTTTTAAAGATLQLRSEVPSVVAVSGPSSSSTLFSLLDPGTTTTGASTVAAIRAAQEQHHQQQLRINHQLQLMLQQQVQQQSALARLVLQRQQLEQITHPLLVAQQPPPPIATVVPQREQLAPSLSSSTPFMTALMSHSGINSVGSFPPQMNNLSLSSNGNVTDSLPNDINITASTSSLLPVLLAPPTHPLQISPTAASIAEVMTVPLVGVTAPAMHSFRTTGNPNNDPYRSNDSNTEEHDPHF